MHFIQSFQINSGYFLFLLKVSSESFSFPSLFKFPAAYHDLPWGCLFFFFSPFPDTWDQMATQVFLGLGNILNKKEQNILFQYFQHENM